jgi:hypothetical protein
MASKKKKAVKAAKGAVPSFNASDIDLSAITKANPYVQRLIEDGELRENITTAIDSGRSAYDRLTSSKAPQKAILDDKKLQNDLRDAAQAVREAAMALSDAPKHPTPKRSGGGGIGRILLIAIVGAIAAMVASEGLRSKVLDLLFGAEEEFQYTPPAGTPAPPPASPVSAA